MTYAMVTYAPPVIMGAGDLVAAAAVLAVLARVALTDARRLIIERWALVALVACGVAWQATAAGEAAVGGWRAPWYPAAGAALGAVTVVGGELVRWLAQYLRPGEPSAFYPADVWLMAAIGYVLGPFALMHTVILGGGLALAWRVLQRRHRRRPGWWRGYASVAPGMAAGAAVVFVGLNAGATYAQEEARLTLIEEIAVADRGSPAGGVRVRAHFAGRLGQALQPVILGGVLEARKPDTESGRARFEARVRWDSVLLPDGSRAALATQLESRFSMLRAIVRPGTAIYARGDVAAAVEVSRVLLTAAPETPSPAEASAPPQVTVMRPAAAPSPPPEPETALAFVHPVALENGPPPGGVRVRARFVGGERNGLAPVEVAGVLHEDRPGGVAVRWDSVALSRPLAGEEWLAAPLVSQLEGVAYGGIPGGRPVMARGDVPAVLAAARRLMAAALSGLAPGAAVAAEVPAATAGPVRGSGVLPAARLGAVAAEETAGPATVPLRMAQTGDAATPAARVEALPQAAPVTVPLRGAVREGDLPADELVSAPGMKIPADIAAREVAIFIDEEAPWPEAVKRIGRESGLEMKLEERPGRVEGGLADLQDPAPAAFYFQGTIRGLLDRMAAHSGYDWEWGPDGAPLFYRYWDRNQRAPAPQAVWKADNERHGSLKAVVEAWGAQARWIVVWEAKRDYELGATATFRGSFLDAVDGLLGGRETRRKLLVRVYPANRHLVVENAGRAAP